MPPSVIVNTSFSVLEFTATKLVMPAETDTTGLMTVIVISSVAIAPLLSVAVSLKV